MEHHDATGVTTPRQTVKASPHRHKWMLSHGAPADPCDPWNSHAAPVSPRQNGQTGDARFAVLVNPGNPLSRAVLTDVQAAASAMGQPIEIVTATTAREISPAFGDAVQKRADALLISADPMFTNRPVHLAILAARHTMPAIYTLREFAEAGGLMSYGSNFTEMFRQAGVYAGRILTGEKPADLPVMQSTKFEFVINLNTANTFGLSFPPGLLAIADEVIE
jgi:ABC-type uncharacterized transport system substrate-binding protein